MATAPQNQGTQKKKKKGGFGEKLKGVGRRIVQEAKKVPGTVYREGIKPEAKRILEKFTEPGPTPARRIRDEPQAGTTAAPFERGPKGLRQGTAEARARSRRALLPAAIKEQVSRPAPTIREQLASPPRGATYALAEGRTTAYGSAFKGRKSAVGRLNEIRAAEERKAGKTPAPKTVQGEVKTTTERPLVERTTTRAPRQRGSVTRAGPVFRTAVTEPLIKEAPRKTAKERRLDNLRRQRAGLMASRKGKPGKRKYSARKTYKEIGKAAGAAAKDIEIERLDTTAQEMARMMTEQDLAREAQRVEAELKEGRQPRRERARYRYRTRGVRRAENRGR